MKQYLRYVLYYTICIVCLVLALWGIWWFTAIKEGFETTAPAFLVLVGKTSTGGLYYADVDVPFTPKWQASSLTATGSIGVAYGQLYTLTGDSSVSKVSSYDAAVSAATSAPALKQISVDDDATVGGIDATGNVYYGSAKNTKSLMKWVSFSGGNAYGVGTDGSLYFNANPASGTWTKTNTGTTWKQVVLSGALVCAINTVGNISYAVNDITTVATIWMINSGPIACPTFSYISLVGKRLIGVGTDSNVYYTDDVTSSLIWRTIPTRVYDNKGVPSTSSATFTAIEIMYPDPAARRKRFIDIGITSCNKSETLIGNYCYQPCSNGQVGIGNMCPYLRQHVPAKATCPAATSLINNTCFNPCSSAYTTTQSGSSTANYTVDPANNEQCIGATFPKTTSQPSTTAVPASHLPCNANNGALQARYIRIRPSMDYINNKLCLQNVTIMGYTVDATGNMGTSVVNLSSTGTAFSTDGACAAGPLAAAATCSFKSGTTYDKDNDGGKLSRMANTYWEVDLGSMQYVKSVAITGCSNTPASSSDDTSNQMRGVRLEILKSSNGARTDPITQRILGPNPNATATGPFTQTVTFKYGEGNANVNGAPPDVCYDVCPMIAGVQSVPQGDGACILNVTDVTNKSVTMPQIVMAQTLLPPADLMDSTGKTIPTTWTADPTDITQFLTCSEFSGSTLTSLTTRTINGNTYTYLNSVTGQPLPNVSGYVCAQVESINVSMCPAYTSTNNGDNPANLAYQYDPTTISCYFPQNLHRMWNCSKSCTVGFNNMSCNTGFIDRYTYCCTGQTFVPGRWAAVQCWTNTSVYDENNGGQYGKSSKDNYALPVIPGNLIRLPKRMPGKQGCFDSAGNKTNLFLYNNSCAKCMGVNDTFYATGLATPAVAPSSGDYGNMGGQAFSLSQIPTLFADDYVAPPATAAPSVNANTTVTIGEQSSPGGQTTNAPVANTTTILSQVTNGLQTAATFFSSLSNFKPSGSPIIKYIQSAGSFMRTLNASDVGTTYTSGICLGKCDTEHSKTLPLQMHVVGGKYTLWGTACETANTYTVKQPSISATYVPESESMCSANTAYNSVTKLCYSECNTLQIDNGESCTYKTIPRPYVSPTYSCMNPALTLDGSVCLYGCKTGTITNGPYCDPVAVVLPNLPTMYGEQVIMCNKTPGGKKSGKDINKWLCESSDYAYLLVSTPCNNDKDPNCIFPDPNAANPNITYSYVGTDDIICYADSSGSTVYVCQSASEYLNAGDTSTKEQTDSQLTCDNLSAAYRDLSNNLSVLASSGSMAQTSAMQLANMQATLQGVYNVLCGTTQTMASCPTLKTQITALTNSINSGSATLANIINPYQMGLTSRTNLVAQMNSMGCTIPK